MLAFTASESLGKTRHESQFPLSSRTEQHHRTGPVEDAYSSSCSEWNTDEKWSSREWKSDEALEARTVRPVLFLQRGAHAFQSRFSREHKNVILEEEENHDRTGRPVVFAQHTNGFIVENDNMDSYTEAESEMSVKSQIILAQCK